MTALSRSFFARSRLAVSSAFCSFIDRFFLLGKSMLSTVAIHTARNSRTGSGGCCGPFLRGGLDRLPCFCCLCVLRGNRFGPLCRRDLGFDVDSLFNNGFAFGNRLFFDGLGGCGRLGDAFSCDALSSRHSSSSARRLGTLRRCGFCHGLFDCRGFCNRLFNRGGRFASGRSRSGC